MSSSSTDLAPVLRWAGSKLKLVDKLEELSPAKFNKYYEPFFGSGCLYFRLSPRSAVLSDLNKSLIEFYTEMRKAPESLIRSSRQLERSPENYYKIRAKYRTEREPFRRAAYFYFLNRFCFNGIYRTNSRGEFNVPYGSRFGGFPSIKKFKGCSEKLKKSTIRCADFATSLTSANDGDFVYLDPPYVYTDRKDRGEYGTGSFGVPDIPRLKQVIDNLDSKGTQFMLSYLDCPEIQYLTKGYDVVKLPVARCISSLASSRQIVNEIVIRNYVG